MLLLRELEIRGYGEIREVERNSLHFYLKNNYKQSTVDSSINYQWKSQIVNCRLRN